MFKHQEGSPRPLRFVRALGILLMIVGAVGDVGYLALAATAGKGPFGILSGLAGYSIVVCFGYWTRAANPKAGSYWWAVLGPIFIGIAPMSFVLLATTVGIATWFRGVTMSPDVH